MAKERTPYIDFEHDGEEYAFRLDMMDVMQLQRAVQAPSGLVQAVLDRREDIIYAATVKGLTNPRNPRKMQKVATGAFRSNWVYCYERIMEAFFASGVIPDVDEDEGYEVDENPTQATNRKTKGSTSTNSSD